MNNLIINKSVNLIGENKINTVILGEQSDITIQIISDNVNVSGFNIKNPLWRAWGIYITSNFNNINNNNISGVPTGTGIEIHFASNNKIYNNIIENNFNNIFLRVSSNNSIFNNTIRYSEGCGITLDWSQNNHIFGNLIEHGQWVGLYLMGDSNRNIIYENSIIHCGSEDDSEGALFIWGSDDNIIYDNNIAFNLRKGIQLEYCNGNQIVHNNFLFNRIDASFYDCLFNNWSGNYWQRPRILPKVIFGCLFLPWGYYKVIPIPLFKFDIHPALIPTYIPPAGCNI